ncbi:helix-turn-helix transcriptional regulator [Anaerovibrio slackiae]|uniref:helix-turn-helix transcriptional regulator n=1 Tax=Anaerovibrio slackiae TaxID=2652309 RepID=UPI003F173C9C
MKNKLQDIRGNRTQAEMAAIYGVTQQCWSNWEKGKKLPGLTTCKRLSDDSGLPIEKIFFGANTTKSS